MSCHFSAAERFFRFRLMPRWSDARYSLFSAFRLICPGFRRFIYRCFSYFSARVYLPTTIHHSFHAITLTKYILHSPLLHLIQAACFHTPFAATLFHAGCSPPALAQHRREGYVRRRCPCRRHQRLQALCLLLLPSLPPPPLPPPPVHANSRQAAIAATSVLHIIILPPYPASFQPSNKNEGQKGITTVRAAEHSAFRIVYGRPPTADPARRRRHQPRSPEATPVASAAFDALHATTSADDVSSASPATTTNAAGR
jgi:hypothetical protein